MIISFHSKRLSCTVIISLIMLVWVGSVTAQVMNLQKAKRYHGDEEISNWMMSEKLDGIRGYWNRKKLLTRKGKMIHPPQWFLENFPPFELDGELWAGRNRFELVQSTVLDKKPTDSWQNITYNIFEVPNAGGDFPARLQKAKDWFKAHPNRFVRFIPQIVCKDRKQLDRFLQAVESKGGEGVIIKDPNLDYHTGKSPHILKVKSFDDMEGVVISINPGKGRLENMMGSLTLKLENGLIFKLGSGFSDKQRKSPPKIGSIVTFKYFGLTKNRLPKFASFIRIRHD